MLPRARRGDRLDPPGRDPEADPRRGSDPGRSGGPAAARICVYSDLDILFLDGMTSSDFRRAVTDITQACWDCGLKLSHSIRSIDDTIAFAAQDVPFCTSLVEARHLWGQAPQSG